MSERARRGSDPARIWSDGRVAYYPSGVAGHGRRKIVRTSSPEEAQALADAVRALRSPTDSPLLATHFSEPLFLAMRGLITHMEATDQPKGTISQYRSNFNTWTPEKVALTRCSDLGLLHWNAIITSAVESGASVGTISAIRRTYGRLATWGMANSYFADEPFGPARLVRDIVIKAKAEAAKRDGMPEQGITLDMCPDADDIDEFADSFELLYPGYGRRLVRLAWCCGGRLQEVAALDARDLDLTALQVRIDRQLDRHNPWPATKLPKYGKTRVADLWQLGVEDAQSLVADATRTGGCLFPPLDGITAWADKLSHLATDAARACGWNRLWTMHWTRHSYATYSITHQSNGGFGIEPKAVQLSLGHAQLSTTNDTYVQSVPRNVDTLRARTSHRPPTPK